MHARRTRDITLSPAMLRGPSLERRTHGLARPPGLDLAAEDARLDDATGLLLPGCALGGWAALRQHGIRYFSGWSPAGTRRALVHCLPGTQLRRRDVVEPFRGLVHSWELTDVEGVPCATIARAAFDEARLAPSTTLAVVAIDMAVSTTHELPHTTLGEIRRVIESHWKVRRIVQARDAVARASSRSASPWETRTRESALDAGCSDLLVNAPVFSTGGALLGIADLFVPSLGLAIESDGEDHRELERHTDDNHREERFEHHGIDVCRVTSLDHGHPRQLLDRLAAARWHAGRDRPQSWTLEAPAWWLTWPPAARWA